MADPYQPALAVFQFDASEVAAIAEAMQTAAPWDWKPGGALEQALNSAKNKIRAYHLQRHDGTCCYCRVNLHGAGPFMTDREHILPKSKDEYRPYTYTMWNLAVACKRCNMQFKKASDAFVIDKVNSATFQSSGNYSLIHPNFDRWEDHLKRIQFQVDAKTMVWYFPTPGSAKAEYTRSYFGLRDLEVDSFDEAQGGPTLDKGSEVAMLVRELVRNFNQ